MRGGKVIDFYRQGFRRTRQAVFRALIRRRPAWILVSISTIISATYVATLFDLRFLSGGGFWNNPVGGWLMDPEDVAKSDDTMLAIAAYYAYEGASWNFPLFLIPSLGTPDGVSGIFVDFIPIVALAGKLVSKAVGATVNPYGVWTGVTFVLSALFATLIMIEASEAHLLGCVIASLFVVSAPPLLHRFGHLALSGHFMVIGALWLYLRDRRIVSGKVSAVCWSFLLCLALLINLGIIPLTHVCSGCCIVPLASVDAPLPTVCA